MRHTAILPIETKITNFKNETLKTPAIKVNGSPTKGTQENINDQSPNLLNHMDARSKEYSFIGNHGLCIKCEKKRPNIQFTTEPNVLPKEARISKIKISA